MLYIGVQDWEGKCDDSRHTYLLLVLVVIILLKLISDGPISEFPACLIASLIALQACVIWKWKIYQKSYVN